MIINVVSIITDGSLALSLPVHSKKKMFEKFV